MQHKRFGLLLLAAGLVLTAGCGKRGEGSAPAGPGGAGGGDPKTIRLIMSDAGFNAEVVPILKSEVERQGFVLEWVVVNDIIQPNKMVDDGTADANSFQHEPYFDQFVLDHDLHNVTRGFYTVFGPSGLYSRKYKRLEDVPDGATFGIPVDPSNNGRALFMLRDRGLLTMRPVEVTHASQKDITANPHNFRFKEVDQLMLQRALDDVDVGFLFSAVALKIGLDPEKDALAREDVKVSPYKGIVAVRKDLAGAPKIRALQAAYESEPLKQFYREHYGNSVLFLDDLNPR